MEKFFKKISILFVFCAVLASFAVVSYLTYRNSNQEEQLISLLVEDNAVNKVFFSPDNDIRSILINLIDCEKRRIAIAVYTITQKDIAHALISAANRGVFIECIVDSSYGTDKYSKVAELSNQNVPIWVFKEDLFDNGLMHNKFCVFEQNILDKSILWTGSYNFTNRANKSNQENVVILDNKQLVNKFLEQFEILKERSILINKSKSQYASGRSMPMRLPHKADSYLFKFFKKCLACLDIN